MPNKWKNPPLFWACNLFTNRIDKSVTPEFIITSSEPQKRKQLNTYQYIIHWRTVDRMSSPQFLVSISSNGSVWQLLVQCLIPDIARYHCTCDCLRYHYLTKHDQRAPHVACQSHVIRFAAWAFVPTLTSPANNNFIANILTGLSVERRNCFILGFITWYRV